MANDILTGTSKKSRTLQASGPLLRTPQGSSVQPSNIINSWESNVTPTAAETAAGYGAVPPMTVADVNTGMAALVGKPSAVIPAYDPYDAAQTQTANEFSTAGNEILNGAAGGSFGTGIDTAGATSGLASTLSNGWNSIGGTKGFADIAGGLGVLGSMYTGYKQNKMAQEEHNARMGELNRQRQRDVDWEKNIKASGLGTYTSGLAQNSAGVK